MNNPCLKCMYAEWKKTKAGRLHPDGSGRCTWKMPEITVPKAFYYVGFRDKVPPKPAGGWIDRRDTRECSAFEEDFP